jgi:hypothetical protein
MPTIYIISNYYCGMERYRKLTENGMMERVYVPYEAKAPKFDADNTKINTRNSSV